MITKDQLRSIVPASRHIDDVFNNLDLLAKYEINSNLRIAGFLSQCAVESAEFNVTTENLNYSAANLNKTFSKYFSKAGRSTTGYAGNPVKIGNLVYANRLGNGSEASGDGYKFRGHGYIQITGRDNFSKFAQHIGMSVDKASDYAQTPRGALESACWFWETHGLNSIADTGDIVAISKRVNGGTNGLSERKKYYARATSVLGATGATQAETHPTLRMGDRGDAVAALQKKLGIPANGIFGSATKLSVMNFQKAHNLSEDGIAGPATNKAIFGN